MLADPAESAANHAPIVLVEEQKAVRANVTHHLAQKLELDEQAFAVEGLRYLRSEMPGRWE